MSRTVFGVIYQFVAKQKWMFLWLQIASFAWALDQVIWPVILSTIVEVLSNYVGLREDIWSAIGSLVIVGALVWVGIEVMLRAAGYLGAAVFPKLEAQVRMYMLENAIKHSQSFFADNFSGAVANKVNDMSMSISSLLTIIIELVIPASALLLVTCGMFAMIHPYFAITLFLWAVIYLWICWYGAIYCAKYSELHSESRSILVGKVVDIFSNNPSVINFARGKFELSRAWKQQDDEFVKQKLERKKYEFFKIFLGICSFVFIGVIITLLQLHFFKSGALQLKDLVYTFYASGNIMMAIWFFGNAIPKLFRDYGIARQALSVLNAPVKIADIPEAKPLKVAKGEITFEKVRFRYEKNEVIFKDKSLTIKAGQKVGLVGFSGSGKTTFVNLILRHFDLESGRILIDKQDVSKVTLQSLREAIAMIPQEPSLFHRSLMENIRYGKLDASDEEVIEAAKVAHCHEFIMKLKDGYQTMVGERGLKLSGGQRQRIAIARGVLKNAPILLMDEATSALDSVTEKYIQDSLQKIMAGKTAIVVAHRLSTLANMDRILVFKEGRIVEDGSHKQLVTKDGHYKMLWDMQSDGFIPDSPDGEDELLEE
jgi:ATP-binding cassette subfamily B protein